MRHSRFEREDLEVCIPVSDLKHWKIMQYDRHTHWNTSSAHRCQRPAVYKLSQFLHDDALLNDWMVFYATFHSISVISWRQLTLFMSFLGFTCTRLGLWSVLPNDTPTKKPRESSWAQTQDPLITSIAIAIPQVFSTTVGKTNHENAIIWVIYLDQALGKHCGKRWNCSKLVISPLPTTMFSIQSESWLLTFSYYVFYAIFILNPLSATFQLSSAASLNLEWSQNGVLGSRFTKGIWDLQFLETNNLKQIFLY